MKATQQASAWTLDRPNHMRPKFTSLELQDNSLHI